MQLTQKGDYAIRAVVDLAAQPAGAIVRADELSRRIGAPEAFLRKILQALAHAGLVYSCRGTSGGIGLLRESQSITLRQVIEAVEGPIYLNRCLMRPGLCSRDSFCPVHPVWARIQEVLIRELEAVRIHDLVDGFPGETQENSSC